MKRVRVKLDFKRISPALLIEFARNIVSKMTGNPLFMTPDVPMPDVEAKAYNLEQKFIAARGGGKAKTAEMHDAKRELLSVLFVLSLYVDKIAIGNETVVLSSGFNGTSQNNPAQKRAFTLENTDTPGEITASCKRIAKHGAYCWQFCVSDTIPAENAWIWAGVSLQTRMCITNLDIDKRVWVRYCAVTRYGMAPWSEPLNIIVR
jgi:hypothetical protein